MSDDTIFAEFAAVYGDKLHLTAREPSYDPQCSFIPFDMDEIVWDMTFEWDVSIDNGPVDRSPNEPQARLYSRTAPKYQLPKAYVAFNRLYAGFGEIENVRSAYHILTPQLSEEGSNCHFNTDIYFKDYFVIFHDRESAANSDGLLYMNMNPESDCYGYIYSFTSSDDGYSGFVAKSFTLLLTKMLTRVITCASICDCLNQLHCECVRILTPKNYYDARAQIVTEQTNNKIASV